MLPLRHFGQITFISEDNTLSVLPNSKLHIQDTISHIHEILNYILDTISHVYKIH